MFFFFCKLTLSAPHETKTIMLSQWEISGKFRKRINNSARPKNKCITINQQTYEKNDPNVVKYRRVVVVVVSEQDVRFKNFPPNWPGTKPNTTPPLSPLQLATAPKKLPCPMLAPAATGPLSYLAVGPFPDKIWARWSRASSRPSSLLPRRLFPSSKLCYTLLFVRLHLTIFLHKKRVGKKAYKMRHGDKTKATYLYIHIYKKNPVD